MTYQIGKAGLFNSVGGLYPDDVQDGSLRYPPSIPIGSPHGTFMIQKEKKILWQEEAITRYVYNVVTSCFERVVMNYQVIIKRCPRSNCPILSLLVIFIDDLN